MSWQLKLWTCGLLLEEKRKSQCGVVFKSIDPRARLSWLCYS